MIMGRFNGVRSHKFAQKSLKLNILTNVNLKFSQESSNVRRTDSFTPFSLAAVLSLESVQQFQREHRPHQGLNHEEPESFPVGEIMVPPGSSYH